MIESVAKSYSTIPLARLCELVGADEKYMIDYAKHSGWIYHEDSKMVDIVNRESLASAVRRLQVLTYADCLRLPFRSQKRREANESLGMGADCQDDSSFERLNLRKEGERFAWGLIRLFLPSFFDN